jgi:hypothetical protein
LNNVTVTGGSCPTGCTFDYTITLIELVNITQFNFTKIGFAKNTTTLNITGDMEVNITMEDNQGPSIGEANITPRLNTSNTTFFIDILINVTDNTNVSNVTFIYNFSQGSSQSGQIVLTRNGDIFNGTIGPYNDSRFFMNSSIVSYDVSGNVITLTNPGVWFTFTAGSVAVGLITDQPPLVILAVPENNSIDNDGNLTFIYTVSDDYKVNNCSLYGNFTGTWLINITDAVVENDAANYFNLGLASGNYIWNVQCYDNASNASFAVANYSLIVNMTAGIDFENPVVLLVNPSNNNIYSNTNNISLQAAVTDNANLSNCTLYTNISGSWAINSTIALSSKSSTLPWSFNDLNNGTYMWNTLCYDNSSNNAWAAMNYSFVINYTPTVQILGVCSNNTAPVIGAIPDQNKLFNPGVWTLNLTPYESDLEDGFANLTWNVSGVNPLLAAVSINPATHVATFVPKPNTTGIDRIVFSLKDSGNLTTNKEISVRINMTIDLHAGWNLFSVPIVENNSVMYILAPLSNGNWGCGHPGPGSSPTTCIAANGDYVGNFTMLWSQDKQGTWVFFRPDEYYLELPSQTLQTMEIGRGYWIKMSANQTLELGYN